MTLAEIRDGWDAAAREDAMFFIITDPSKSNGGWTADDFFAHGRAEIDQVMARVAPWVKRKGRALDFGCGVGRLTQALADHFKRVDGVDASPEMIDRARSLNACSRVEFHRNGARLPYDTATFDFVYSMVVLQHMPHRLQRGYVREFFRVLKAKGAATFEVPSGPDVEHSQPWLSMFGTPRPTVEAWLRAEGVKLKDVESMGQDASWFNYRYTAVKP